MPKVWNARHRDYPQDAIQVDRGSRWGNPYPVIKGKRTREQSLAAYHEYLERNPALVAAIKAQLRGKDLVCWCAPLPCHADIILEIANGE